MPDHCAKKAESGVLYLVASPIGNLKDMTPRALEILAGADLIAAEDTRVTARLLADFNLPFKDLISYHSHNEQARSEVIIDCLSQGKTVVLVSDAGMPAISDPGAIVVKKALAEGFDVLALPGPSAGITALAASGLDTRYFYFEGFIPAAGSDRKNRMELISKRPETSIIYEAPHRLEKTLQDFEDQGMGERWICLGREISKKYEEYIRTEVSIAKKNLQNKAPRGEFVLVLEGLDEYFSRKPLARQAEEASQVEGLKVLIKEMLGQGLGPKSIYQNLQHSYPISKNEIYSLVKELQEEI